MCCRQAVIGVILATLPIIVSCLSVGIITSVKNYPAAIPDAVNYTFELVSLCTLIDNSDIHESLLIIRSNQQGQGEGSVLYVTASCGLW